MVTILDVMGLGNLPELSKPKDILNYMIALQVRVYGESIDLGYRILLRNLKLLIKEYGTQAVIRGIYDAGHQSDFPFSTKHVEQQIVWRLENEKCPAVQYTNILDKK